MDYFYCEQPLVMSQNKQTGFDTGKFPGGVFICEQPLVMSQNKQTGFDARKLIGRSDLKLKNMTESNGEPY